MNFQEQTQLNIFLQQLIQAQPQQKDPEAETLIKESCGKQPDAYYLLVQRALLLDQALQGMKDQINKLQMENNSLRNPSQDNSPSFLGKGWNSTPLSNAPSPGVAAPAAQPSAPVSNTGSGASTFLQGAATTAAGVVAGAFLFQGIESLMGHPNTGGWGSNSGQVTGLTENTVVNNYYETTPSSDNLTDLAAFDDGNSSDWI